MSINILKTTNDEKFKPIKIEMEITSRESLIELYYRLRLDTGTVFNLIVDERYELPEASINELKNGNSYTMSTLGLYEHIENIIIGL